MAVAAAFAGLIWTRPAAVRHEISWLRSPGGGTPTWVSRASREWLKHIPRPKPDWPENGSKRPSSGPRVLGNFSKVLKLKMSVLGLGFYLASKTRFI